MGEVFQRCILEPADKLVIVGQHSSSFFSARSRLRAPLAAMFSVEAVMKKALIIIPFAAVTTACVPMYGAGTHGMSPAYPYRPVVSGPSVAIPMGSPVG